MKDNFALRQLCLVIILVYVSSSFDYAPKKTNFQHYYYLQKLYPGTDPIQSLNYNANINLVHFTLNKNMLFYKKSPSDKGIQDSIKLSKIVDKKLDNLKEGKCCFNLNFQNFAPKRSKISPRKSILSGQLLMNMLKANFCLEILVPNEARWRVCSDKAKDISKLQLQIEFNILRQKTGKKSKSIIGNKEIKLENFLKRANVVSKPKAVDFTWEDQLRWRDRCKSTFMQSPINIQTISTVGQGSSKGGFLINYNFLDTFVRIEKRFGEAIIKFVNNPGLITLTSGNNNVIYIPKYISFRFPGEHIIQGKKYDGEMLIHCSELNPDKKRRGSNGLIITIPLDNNSDNSNLDTLESLNLDSWNFSLSQSNFYIPTDFITQQQNVFSFSNLLYILKKDQPNFIIYLGSKTTPPCEEFVYHLISTKPLKISNCQFKLLREHSLLTNSNIHARLTQPDNKRKIFSMGSQVFSFNQNVERMIPAEYAALAQELDGEPLLPEKLSTISQLKALKKTKKLISQGGRFTKDLKYNKKGLQIISKGINIKKLALKKVGKGALSLSKQQQEELRRKGLLKGRKAGKGDGSDDDGEDGDGTTGRGKGRSRKGKLKLRKSSLEKGTTSGEYSNLARSSDHTHDLNC